MDNIYHYIIYHGGFAHFLNTWFLGFGVSMMLSLFWIAHHASDVTEAQRVRTLRYIAFVFAIASFFAFVIINGVDVESRVICETIFNESTVKLESNLCVYQAGNLILKIPVKEREIYSLSKGKYIERNELDYIIFNFYEEEMGKDNPIYFAQRNKDKIYSVFKDKKEEIATRQSK